MQPTGSLGHLASGLAWLHNVLRQVFRWWLGRVHKAAVCCVHRANPARLACRCMQAGRTCELGADLQWQLRVCGSRRFSIIVIAFPVTFLVQCRVQPWRQRAILRSALGSQEVAPTQAAPRQRTKSIT